MNNEDVSLVAVAGGAIPLGRLMIISGCILPQPINQCNKFPTSVLSWPRDLESAINGTNIFVGACLQVSYNSAPGQSDNVEASQHCRYTEEANYYQIVKKRGQQRRITKRGVGARL